MPAEWEPHCGTWLTWPHRRADWPGKFSPIRSVYAEIVRSVSRFETINLIVSDESTGANVRHFLVKAGVDASAVRCYPTDTDRSWVRDSGPIFVKDPAGNSIALDFRFNAWAKYPNWRYDDRIPEHVANWRGVPRVEPERNGQRVILEGGSIDVNGAGLLLTTEECLLSPVQQRNPPFDQADYEAVFADYLGITGTIWLNRGIVGDDTHGHVDDLARFVGPNAVVTVVEANEADENHEPLRDNLDRLRGYITPSGGRLDVIPLPMPRPLYFDGVRLPASYANFYIANGVVIVPTFNDPADRVALGILGELFPDREVVGIHCVDLVWGLGTLHCMTQQEPA
jgi:agmatine deiminase